MTTERRPMVKLAELWQRTSAAGNVYYSGFMGRCQVLMFDDSGHPHPTREGETVHVWKLLPARLRAAEAPGAITYRGLSKAQEKQITCEPAHTSPPRHLASR